MNDVIQSIREMRFAEGLSDEEHAKLAAISELVQFPAGTTIFTEGDTSNHVYLIRDGRVELQLCAPAKGCQTLLTLEGGDLLGWSPVLTQFEMTATAIATKETDAIRINARELQALCEADHDIGYAIMRRIAVALSNRLVATRLQVMDVHADNISE